jgi:RNA 2',3'-cyclic 3'-phosphodiesterase
VLPPKRLFVGLELSSTIKAALFGLDPHLPGLRWLPEEQLHLTLSFLGEVEATAEDRLRQALGEVRVPPFFLALRSVGVFDAGGRPSVVWVGVGKGHPHLFALHSRIQDAVLRVRLEPDLKPFHPHVTVGRAKGISRQALQPFLRQACGDGVRVRPDRRLWTLFKRTSGGRRNSSLRDEPKILNSGVQDFSSCRIGATVLRSAIVGTQSFAACAREIPDFLITHPSS